MKSDLLRLMIICGSDLRLGSGHLSFASHNEDFLWRQQESSSNALLNVFKYIIC